MYIYRVSVQTLLTISTIVAMSACSGGGDSSGGGSDTTPVKRYSTVASASVIAPGAICANGGIQVDTGIDENGNGLLDSDEIDNTEYVCNGLDGQDGANGQDGADGQDGANGQDGADGQDGKNSLILVTDEPSGTHCTYGGSRIDVGVDTDSSGDLNTSEITATTYLCRSAADVPANGYAVTDAWGEVWDGLSRPAANLVTAKMTCNSLGGRLPTATELYRNNKTTGLSSSSISATSESEYLWTILPTTTPSFNVVVRLNDGLSSSADVATPIAYRCVWADTAPAGFTADNCNGTPGEGCWSREYNSNIDTRDRLPLDYAAASAECAFYHASLPVTGEAGTLIHQGLPNGSGNFVWTSDPQYWYNGNYGEALIKWNDLNSSQWAYGIAIDTYGSVSGSSAKQAFRCIGESNTDGLVDPVPTCQNGECFTVSNRRSVLIADATDRAASTQDVAFETCSLLGGALPSYDEFSDLIHAGLPNGTNNWLWTSNPVYWYNGGYGLGTVKWSATGTPEWSYTSGSGDHSIPTLNRPYRCVWHQKVNDYPVCGATDGLNRVQNSYVCAPSTDGTSNNNANPNGIEIVDSRGNAWDLIQRGLGTYDAAESVCKSLGGRLPTPSEIYAVRANQSLEPSIGDTNSVSYLWSRIDGYRPNYNVTTRVSDGASAPALKTANNAYRCIWPSTKGNVLAGRSCYGGCFKADNKLIADSYDRGAVSANAAIQECKEAGGHLPDLREMQTLIHKGWENGSNTWLWVNESEYWYSGGYGYALARWSGIGNSTWAYDSTNGTVGSEGGYRSYRCVYSNERR